MQQPGFPDNERLRLDTLHSLRVLDTDAEERFDRLTRMAKRLFGVRYALVSLVDANRQWFKSKQGLDACETPRSVSFCGHAILGDSVFVIEDACADPRFADNPLVTGSPWIRFYAGAPLSAPNGVKLGTLCIIDSEPRSFGSGDVEALQDLAVMVERELSAMCQATVDDLTGITNRRGFMMLAEQALRFCARNKLPVSLAFLDLDGFKQVNDVLGHAAGDRLLQEFADALRAVFRDSDLFARLGGDEFVVLLSDCQKEDAQMLLERLRAISPMQAVDGARSVPVGFSAGVVSRLPVSEGSVIDLLAEGDALMYRAKHAHHSA